LAHREKSDCSHGRGMTEWHYRWIERHFEKDGWDVEYIDGNRRYDCFNQQKSLAVEIKTLPNYDYILDKTAYITTRNIKVKWILYSDIFRDFRQSKTNFETFSKQRLVILDILEEFADNKDVEFYIDSLASISNGLSSKGLFKLEPTNRLYNTLNFGSYYKVNYVRHDNK